MDNNNPDDSVKLVLHDAENKLEDKADEALDHALDVVEDKVDEIIENIENEEVAAVAEVGVEIVKDVVSAGGKELIDMAGDEIFEKLEEKCKDVGIKRETLAVLLKFIIEAVEETPLKGADQKEYAIRLLTALVQKQAEEPEKSAILDAIETKTIEGMIDLIISASKGELNINQVGEVVTSSCVPCCLKFVKRRSKKSN